MRDHRSRQRRQRTPGHLAAIDVGAAVDARGAVVELDHQLVGRDDLADLRSTLDPESRGELVGFLFGDWVELQGFYLRSGSDVEKVAKATAAGEAEAARPE